MKAVDNPCYHFRGPINSHGECCCNCQHQRPITSHPWNESDLAKGPISQAIGYGCTHPEFFPHITFFESNHGMCEMWEKNTWRKELADAEEKREKQYVWNILNRPIEENK